MNMEWKTAFLLGAGASKAAGVKTVEEMFADFRNEITTEESKLVDSLEQYLQEKNIIDDILNMALFFEILDLFQLLDCSLFLHLFKMENEDWSVLHQKKLKTRLKKYIREGCIIDRERIDYLVPFIKYITAQPACVDVFTLNYDYTLETAAEYMEVPYTDGFSLKWDQKLLSEDNQFKLKLYKLHGSIIWYKVNGQDAVKLPLINCQDDLKHFFDENISEMMVYPQLSEEVIFETLFSLFEKKLNKINLLIISGYSFHDDEVNDCLLQALQKNKELAYLIISPEAVKLKKHFFQNNERILTEDYHWEEFLKKGGLTKLNSL